MIITLGRIFFLVCSVTFNLSAHYHRIYATKSINRFYDEGHRFSPEGCRGGKNAYRLLLGTARSVVTEYYSRFVCIAQAYISKLYFNHDWSVSASYLENPAFDGHNKTISKDTAACTISQRYPRIATWYFYPMTTGGKFVVKQKSFESI